MKTLLKLTAVFALALQLCGCTDRFSSRFTLELPEAPHPWASILGEPWWQVEWLDPGGNIQKTSLPPGTTTEVNLPATWVNPVTALPFWPEHSMIPGFAKPAGALFPLDVTGGRLRLTWEGGADSAFYWELAARVSQTLDESGNFTRIPANFDWARFRELFKTDALHAEAAKDPWLVDWQNAAQRTIDSGFDRRRITPRPAELVPVTVPAGVWYGASPFADPLPFAEGQAPVFSVFPGMNVWVSSNGILRVNGNIWVFTEMKREEN